MDIYLKILGLMTLTAFVIGVYLLLFWAIISLKEHLKKRHD